MRQQLHPSLSGKPLLGLRPLSVSLLLSLVVVLHSVSSLDKSFDEESVLEQKRPPLYKQGRDQELKSPKDENDKPIDELLMSLIEKYLKQNSAEKQQKLSSHKQDATLPGSESECGVSDVQPKVDSRIVGGVEATPHSWPWQVRIIGTLPSGDQTVCGGSIFSSHWVITAAHCVLDVGTAKYKIVLGAHNIQNYERTVREFEIEKIIKHKGYNNNTQENDIALIRLPKDVQFNRNIKPICLPDGDVKVGTRCVATGWGLTQSTGNANVLNQVYLPVISNSQCNYEDWYGGMVKGSMFCAGYPEGGKSPCSGDSGGPLACLSKGKWKLYGLSSWFASENGRCAEPRHPLVFTRVNSYAEWISKNTEKNK